MMPLIVKRSWNPDGSEKRILDHLKRIFKNDKEDIFLFHNVLIDYLKEGKESIRPIKPDFILVSKTRGIAIIEVKSWEDFRQDGNYAIKKNGKKTLNPLVTAENYYFGFQRIMMAKNKDLNLISEQLQSHIVFTNQIHDPALMGRFFKSHFINYPDTLDAESIFKNTSLSPELYEEIMSFLNPAIHFSMQSHSGLEKVHYHLDEKQTQIISKSPFGHYLVSGVPGSGKSILVVSRALYLKEVCPNWKILILCTNRNLNDKHVRDLEERTGKMAEGIECQTYISFLKNLCSPDDEEINDPKKKSYSSKLKIYREKAAHSPLWDAILVDEYQDFTEKDFEIILKSCKKHEAVINKESRFIESLFLAGDMLQKIREEGCSYSWEKMNIHISGRSTILKNSYRCTSEILKVSLQYLKDYNKTLEAEVKKFYDGTNDIKHSESKKLSVELAEKWVKDEILNICNSIRALIDSNVAPSNIIVVAPQYQETEFAQSLKDEIRKGLILANQHTVKGLEAPHVFIFNLSSILHRMHNNPTVKARMVYMLMTRANTKLYLSSYGGKDEDFNRVKEIVGKMRKKSWWKF